MCFCWHGFELSVDSRKCVDIDECQAFGACSQQCMNTRGSYKCQCNQGYVSDGVDGKECKATGELYTLWIRVLNFSELEENLN